MGSSVKLKVEGWRVKNEGCRINSEELKVMFFGYCPFEMGGWCGFLNYKYPVLVRAPRTSAHGILMNLGEDCSSSCTYYVKVKSTPRFRLSLEFDNTEDVL